MRQKNRTTPNLTDSSPAHQAAIEAGTDHFHAWQYNVADRFKSKTVDEIKETLRAEALPFAVCFEHLINDFNMGSAVRNANAFNAKEIFYVGDKKWDRRAAVGVYNYTEVQWLPTLDDLIKLKDRYTFIGIDNIPGKSTSLSSYCFPFNSLLIFGEEGVGLTPTIQFLCQEIVCIEQYGSVRSLNVGVASGIIMYEAARQLKRK
jgi:tRNA G18 (ribose-2'-O)-methylase SpoU